MGTMVVGVDGSPGAAAALAWAIDAARARDASVKAVHSWTPVLTGDVYGVVMVDTAALEDAARATLDESVDGADTSGLRAPVERVIVLGPATGGLIQQAQHADLIVVGSRGRGGFAGLLLGSVSHQLVQHAPCPVVVVPAEWKRPADRRIVVGVDGSDGAAAALRWALEWAGPAAAQVEVVLAFDSDVAWIDVGTHDEAEWVERGKATAEAVVRRIVDEVAAGRAGEDVHPVVAEGAPARVLLDRAQDADLLVVGTRGRGGFAGLLLGSVSQRCAEHAPCPVAVVPAPVG